jgi:CheY-like chemotaxis protein/anti-sigma regulatory factor (Ser/Thr protein kinase)
MAVAPAPPALTVHGDPARLEQVVSNLVSNAIELTPAGGRVDVACRRAGSRVEIEVRDSGKGIAPEFLPHVFDRFSQAEGATTRQHRGLGLGLTLVKFLVEQHGGTVRAESEGAGRGATFTVSLPLAAVRRADEASPIEACASLEGVRALVVDDEPDARELIGRILEDCEAEVVAALSAADAMDHLQRFRPDVVISDIGMPGQDGYDFIRAVRALDPDRGGATPAVALTAFARPEDRLRALRAGYQTHLAKPVDQNELVMAVARVTGRLDEAAWCEAAPAVP